MNTAHRSLAYAWVQEVSYAPWYCHAARWEPLSAAARPRMCPAPWAPSICSWTANALSAYWCGYLCGSAIAGDPKLSWEWNRDLDDDRIWRPRLSTLTIVKGHLLDHALVQIIGEHSLSLHLQDELNVQVLGCDYGSLEHGQQCLDAPEVERISVIPLGLH